MSPFLAMSPRLLVLFAAIAALSGCGRALGPERMETATVRGRLHFRDVPIASGWLEFMPIDGTIGRLRSAKLAADGSFEGRGIPVGRLAIRLAGPPLPRMGDPMIDKYLYTFNRYPLIHRDVPPGGGPMMDIEVRDEAIAFYKTYGTRP